MLADGEKILYLREVPHIFTIVNTTNTVIAEAEGERGVFHAVVVAGHALASVNPPNSGGVMPADLGQVDLFDEGTRWVRGWDREARDALLAANKLCASDDATE